MRGEIAGTESRLETKIAESDARNAERYAKIAEGQDHAVALDGRLHDRDRAGVLVSTLLLGT